MKAHEIPEEDRKCLNCAFCMMHDASCAHPETPFYSIEYDAEACEHFETEELYSVEKK